MDQNTNIISWFEIPVVDFERAKAFYEAIEIYQYWDGTSIFVTGIMGA